MTSSLCGQRTSLSTPQRANTSIYDWGSFYGFFFNIRLKLYSMKHTFVYLISEIRNILTAAKINKCLSIYWQGLLLFFLVFSLCTLTGFDVFYISGRRNNSFLETNTRTVYLVWVKIAFMSVGHIQTDYIPVCKNKNNATTFRWSWSTDAGWQYRDRAQKKINKKLNLEHHLAMICNDLK